MFYLYTTEKGQVPKRVVNITSSNTSEIEVEFESENDLEIGKGKKEKIQISSSSDWKILVGEKLNDCNFGAGSDIGGGKWKVTCGTDKSTSTKKEIPAKTWSGLVTT